jgi:hypothetical protein
MKLKVLLPLLSCLLWQPLLASPVADAPNGQAVPTGDGRELERPVSPCGVPGSLPKPQESPASQEVADTTGTTPTVPPPAAKTQETAALDPERGWFLAARISLLH